MTAQEMLERIAKGIVRPAWSLYGDEPGSGTRSGTGDTMWYRASFDGYDITQYVSQSVAGITESITVWNDKEKATATCPPEMSWDEMFSD